MGWRRPDLPDSDDVDAWLRRQWQAGVGIGQARLALRRQGHELTAGQVRTAFARFAQDSIGHC